jgi:hypothetical protein
MLEDEMMNPPEDGALLRPIRPGVGPGWLWNPYERWGVFQASEDMIEDLSGKEYPVTLIFPVSPVKEIL